MRRLSGGLIPPTGEQLRDIAARFGFSLDNDQTDFFVELIDGSLASYRRVGELPDEPLPVKYPRTPGYRPEPEDNPLNAWHIRCSIQGADEGKLAGRQVVVKDPVAVAGVPTMAGSAIMEGFVPDVDATIVTRILDAGGEIIGKSVCEDMCISGGSITSNPVPVRNPHNADYSAGGSSSGSAALVVSGAADMGIGADQGGSIRLPSALSGAVGLKPTYGLVPYTGVFPIENSLDHVGPICRTVEDTALLLEVIAGWDDDLDPRQRRVFDVPEYTAGLTGDLTGKKVGILTEGFDLVGMTLEDQALIDDAQTCAEAVREAAQAMTEAGAEVVEISVPMHLDGPSIYSPILIDGAAMQMFALNGMGIGHKGYWATGAQNFYGSARKALAESYSDLCKLLILMGTYTYEQYNGRYYAKAQNQMRRLARAYDQALNEVDVLVMPTAAPIPRALPISDDPANYIAETFLYHLNACPFDGTGHPALNVPAARVEGMPVGMMLVGRKWDDASVLEVGHGYQQLGRYVA